MQCEDIAVQLLMKNENNPMHVNLSISKNIVVTGTNNGQVRVLDIGRKAMLYKGAHHGRIEILAVCTYNNVVATGAVDG